MISWERVLQLSVLLVSCVTCLEGKSLGAKTTVSEAAMEYGTRMFTWMIQQKMVTFHIPQSKGEIESPIGGLEYYTKNVHLTDFEIGNTSMDATPDVGLRMIISAESSEVIGDWGYKMNSGFFHISDEGQFKASIDSAYFDVVVAMAKDDTSQSTLTMVSCEAGVGSMELGFDGGASWLYNIISPVIVKVLERQLGYMMCESVEKTVLLGGWMGQTSGTC